MSADYEKWQAILDGATDVLIHNDEPECGFWRMRDKTTGRYHGVAIWRDESGHVLAVRNRQPARIEHVWPYAHASAVSEQAYRTWDETGTWPDEHAIEAAPERGTNEPADDAEMLRDQIESAKAGVADYATIDSDEHAARAQSLRSRLLELHGQADKIREKNKRPHFEAAKAVDAKYMPMVKAAKEAADAVAKAMGAYETAKAKAAAQARAKAEAEQRAREEAERKAAAEAASEGRPMSAPLPVLEPEPAPPLAPAPRTTVKGAYGRAASVRVVKIARVVDRNAASAFLQNEPDVSAAVDKAAQRATDAGIEVPGVEVDEQRRVA